MNITGKTFVTGVMGYPVRHSLSPVFQNAAFKSAGLDFIYVPFEVSPGTLGAAVEGIKAMNIKGVNLTIPHKKEVLRYLDELSEEAGILGVANTIINENGKLKGDITDGCGFVASMKEDGFYDPEGKNVFLLGAGGSAYAISGALVKAGISKIYICNRTEEKSKLLKDHLKEKLGFLESEIVPYGERSEYPRWKTVHFLVNSTSVGMSDNDLSPVKAECIEKLEFLYDIVYNRETRLVREAKAMKIPCLNGISMLVYQGAVSFELWTGVKAPVDVMKNALGRISP